VKELKGHQSNVNALLINNRRCELVSAGSDYTIRIWELDTGMCVKTFFAAHDKWITSLCLPRNNFNGIISGANDALIKIWSVDSGQCVQTLDKHTGAVNALLMTDKDQIVSASDDTTIRVWSNWNFKNTSIILTSNLMSDLVRGVQVRTLKGHKSEVRALLIDPKQPEILISGSNEIIFWNLNTDQAIRTLHGHGTLVRALAIAPSGLLVSAAHEKRIKVWNCESGELVKMIHAHEDWIGSLVVNENGHLISGSCDSTVRIWDLEAGKHLKTLQGIRGANAVVINTQRNNELIVNSVSEILILHVQN
jgi:WD40 repeat protein